MSFPKKNTRNFNPSLFHLILGGLSCLLLQDLHHKPLVLEALIEELVAVSKADKHSDTTDNTLVTSKERYNIRIRRNTNLWAISKNR